MTKATTQEKTVHDNFSAKLTHTGKGQWPTLKGFILEGDSQIGTFSRGAIQKGFIPPPMTYKFSSERARNRLADCADCLSMEEIIECLIGSAA